MGYFDFSVIVCCYNSDYEKLKKTLISIIKQKDIAFEIIISDDGSKDRSVENIKTWISEHKIPNVKYNFLTENVGTVGNILSAVKLTEGKYVKTISPGDYFFDEFSLKQYLQKFNKNDYKLVFSRAIYYTQDREILKFHNPIATGTKSRWFMKKNLCTFFDCFLGATFSCEREYILPYLQELVGVVRLVEDFPLTFLTLINNQKVGFINKNLVWYESDTGVSRVNGGSKIESEYFNFFDYIEKKYQNNKKVQGYIKFLRRLKTENKYKVLLKSLLIQPSYLCFRIDLLLTKISRKFLYLFDKTNLTMMDKITTL